MATLSEALAMAAQHYRAGNHAEAERIYRKILEVDPTQADAWHICGIIAHLRGDHAEARKRIEQAIAVRGTVAAFHFNLGVILKSLQLPREAVASFQRALQLQPNYAEAYYNLGVVLSDLQQLPEAVHCYQQAIQLNPNFSEAYFNLGTLLSESQRFEEALKLYQRAIQANPHDAESFNNLGSAYKELGQLEEAYNAFDKAVELNPHYSIAKFNLGVIHMVRGEYDHALQSFQRLIAVEPNAPDWHLYAGMVLLMQGRLAEGWSEYEWRLQNKIYGTNIQQYQKPCWQGEPLGGKTILLHAEQGLGDSIQFIRYAALLKQAGAHMLFHVSRALQPLLSRYAAIDRIVPEGEPLPAYDYFIPLLSVPQRLHTTLETIPHSVPYLSAAPNLIEAWRERLQTYTGFRVGINWRGGQGIPAWQLRDLPLELFAPLSQLPNVHLISLQKGDTPRDEAAARRNIPLIDFGDEVDQEHGAFMDTAAIMKNLDLVITSDTSTAHLAGALGVPVWVALPFSADWRWLLNREDSPWYPTMRLLRQTQRGEWVDVFERIKFALRETMTRSAHSKD
jgi:tetratricopeptide (TPR) repeat protein